MSKLNVISLSEEKIINGQVFPLTVGPTEEIKTIEDSIEFIKSNMDLILSKLLIHGAILFRGFPVQSAKDFNDFALAFGWEDLPYIG
jgi:hypothetical protein